MPFIHATDWNAFHFHAAFSFQTMPKPFHFMPRHAIPNHAWYTNCMLFQGSKQQGEDLLFC